MINKLTIIFLLLLTVKSYANENFVVPNSLLNQVENGNAEVAYFISNAFYSGNEKYKPNKAQGFEWLKKAAEMGYPHAILDLADELYFNDEKEEALPWFKKAVELGMGAAMNKIAMYHSNGYAGIEKSCKQAYLWYEKAEEKQNMLAYNNHAWYLATHSNRECRNPEKAIKLIFELIVIYGGEPMPWHVWDTKAAVLASVSDFGQAIKLQERLVKETKDTQKISAAYQMHLDSYKMRKPWIEKNSN